MYENPVDSVVFFTDWMHQVFRWSSFSSTQTDVVHMYRVNSAKCTLDSTTFSSPALWLYDRLNQGKVQIGWL